MARVRFEQRKLTRPNPLFNGVASRNRCINIATIGHAIERHPDRRGLLCRSERVNTLIGPWSFEAKVCHGFSQYGNSGHRQKTVA
jgi:hypothetical protein